MAPLRRNTWSAIKTLLGLQLMWSSPTYAKPTDVGRRHHRHSAPVKLEDLVETGNIGFDQCKKNLIQSDSNRDGVVNSREFVTFLQHEQPGTFDDVTHFQALPVLLKVTFSTLACFCTNYGGSASCCLGENAGINITGTGTKPTFNETEYLFQVCVLTESTIQNYLSNISPPASPTSLITPSPYVASVPKSSKATRLPTLRPTRTPTLAPTPTPTPLSTGDTLTAVETPAPTPSPSLAPPTIAPLKAQSLAPTAAPTTRSATPTSALSPITAPSGVVTVKPSARAPTIAPSLPTTRAPSTGPHNLAVTKYTIAVRNGNVQQVPQSNYTSALIEAMNRLAADVGLQVFSSSKMRLRRMLQTKVITPTNITGIASTNCPSGVSPNDVCEVVTSSVTLVFSDSDNQTEITNYYLAALNTDINVGRLQSFLTTIDPNTVVRILSELPPSPASASTLYVPNTSKSLSPGATAGIVLGSVAVVLLSLVIWAVRRRRAQDVKGDVIDYPCTIAASLSGGASFENSTDAAAVASIGHAAMAVTQRDFDKNKGKSSDYDAQLAQGDNVVSAENVGTEFVNVERPSSSTAGSSGRSLSSEWSSSASSAAMDTSWLPTSGDDNPDADQEKPSREEQEIFVHREIGTPIVEPNRTADKDMDTIGDASQTSGDQREKASREPLPLGPGEIWTKLAEQSKTEGEDSTARCRPDEWAIARSLSAFREALQRGDLKGKQSLMDVYHEDDDRNV